MTSAQLITLPVVVRIVRQTAEQNISDAQVKSRWMRFDRATRAKNADVYVLDAYVLLGERLGPVWHDRVFPDGHTYDVGVMVLFLFQMVFMDTALTIVTGSVAERWKYIAFCISSVVLGGLTYPLFAHWAWGGGWLTSWEQTLGWALVTQTLPDRV